MPDEKKSTEKTSSDNGNQAADLTAEQLKQIIDDRDSKDVKECQQEMAVIMNKYSCRLRVSTLIQDNKIQSRVEIVKITK